jgi:YVTN family beta-propeller protein
MVTDDELCNLVDEENKECQICGVLVSTLLAPSAASIVFNAINTYDPNPPDGETGLEAICTSDNPITAYNTFVDQIPYPPADPGLQLFLNKQFATCEGVADTCGAVTVGPNITGFNAPRDIAYDPVLERMYVVTRGGNTGGTVSIIDTTTNAQIPGSPIQNVGTAPFGIAYDPVNQEMYVTNQEGGGNTVSRIDTTSTPPVVVGTVTVGAAPLNLAYDPFHKTMYVTNLGGTSVSVIDTTASPPVQIDTDGNIGNGITPITVGSQPWGIAYDPFHKTMYVTNFSGASVSVIDTNTNTVITTINAPGVLNGPTDITYDPVHERMYVTNFNGNTVSVIDTETNTIIGSPIGVGALPVYVTFDPINQDMYVTNQGGTTVSVIDTLTNTVSTIQLAPNASGLIGIAYDPENQRMYVGGRDSGTVSVINLCPAII